MYNHGRYFTVTGQIYGTPKEVEERTAEFKQVYDKYFSEPAEIEKIRITKNS